MTPRVSILVPCYNEADTIGRLLQAICDQQFQLEELEVIIADGQSTDETLGRIEAFRRTHRQLHLRVVANPDRSIPAALNRAWRAADGEFLVRLDAHSAPLPDYIHRCIDVLQATAAANVGGRWEIEPGAPTWIARSIAVATADPLGAGDARYRTGGPAGPVDTVPFGAFPRPWLERLGGYDESLLTNEDYELNWRLRQQGGTVWFDPSIRCRYYARSRLGDLGRQYVRYGYWKAHMIRRNPSSLRWRQAIPAGFVLGSLAMLGVGLFLPLGWLLLAALWAVYLLVLSLRALVLAWKRKQLSLILGVPVALVVIHLSWGGAFLAGLVDPVKARGAQSA